MTHWNKTHQATDMARIFISFECMYVLTYNNDDDFGLNFIKCGEKYWGIFHDFSWKTSLEKNKTVMQFVQSSFKVMKLNQSS